MASIAEKLSDDVTLVFAVSSSPSISSSSSSSSSGSLMASVLIAFTAGSPSDSSAPGMGIVAAQVTSTSSPIATASSCPADSRKYIYLPMLACDLRC